MRQSNHDPSCSGRADSHRGYWSGCGCPNVGAGRSWWAILAGYFGLFSLLCFPGPIAVVLGIIAIWDVKNNPQKHGMVRAIFGLAMGLTGTVVLIAVIIAYFG